MASNIVYIIYRNHDDQPPSYYGWSHSKKMVKMFLQQRTKYRYRIKEFDIGSGIPDNSYDEDTTLDINLDVLDSLLTNYQYLDYVELPSVQRKENIILLSTHQELSEATNRVKSLFREASSLSNTARIKDPLNLVEAFMNLKPYYASALDLLGFRPPEITNLFDSVEDEYVDNYSNNEKEKWLSNDILQNVIYTFESYVKVMKDDL